MKHKKGIKNGLKIIKITEQNSLCNNSKGEQRNVGFSENFWEKASGPSDDNTHRAREYRRLEKNR